MIPFSPAARRQLRDLLGHYERLERIEAIENLRTALRRAADRIRSRRGLYFAAPRPYPELSGLGYLWTKEGAYWIAYRVDPDGPRFYAICHEAADIPNRL